MIEPIPGGSFLIARKIFKSKIWLKHPFYLKIFLWILGNTNHSDQKKHGYSYKRGELITTYDEIIKGAAYYFNRKHIVPTLKQVRLILQWLEVEGIIIVEPLKANDPTERPTGADPRARTRAYVGIRIIVVNYEPYQDLKSYKGRDKGRPSVQLGHNNNNEEERKNIYSEATSVPHRTNSLLPIAKRIIDHLNQVGDRNFTYSNANLEMIQARLEEGHTEEECKQVIDTKWNDSDFNKKYFRPSTLFRPTKFEGYLNEKPVQRYT